MDKLYLSLLDINVKNLEKSLMDIKALGIKKIHLDIIDTSFCNNISFGISTINTLLEFDFEFNLHLMVDNPLKVLKLLKINRKTTITVHKYIQETKEAFESNKNIEVGLAISPDDSFEKVKHLIPYCSHVLIMSVVPGMGGQKMILETLSKKIAYQKFNIKVGIDGGVNTSNVELVKDFDFIVVGSAITLASDKAKAIAELVKKLEK